MNNIIEFSVRDEDDGHFTHATNRVHLIKAIRRLTGPKKDLAWCRDRVDEGRIDTRDLLVDQVQDAKDVLAPYVWFADIIHGEDQDMKPAQQTKTAGFSLPDEINNENLEDFATHLEQLAVLVRNMKLMRYPNA